MLDRRTGRLLAKLNALCARSAFCIVEEEELLFAGEDGESVKGMLGFLKDRGYLELGYAEGGEYCVRILPEGRLYFERAAAEKKDEQRRNRMEALCAFFGALLGAALSGGIVALIVLL
jgi:hypothetical protein